MNPFVSKSDRKRQDFANKVAQFGFENKDSFVVMADVNLNVIVASYKGQETAFHNKSRTKRIDECFQVNPAEDFNEDGSKNLNSKRNVAIRQLLYELDGVINDLGQKWYNLREGKKGLAKAISSGMIKGFGVKDEKGNTKELISVR